jgi:hypothetical protein
LTRRGRRVVLEGVAMLASTALVIVLPTSVQSTGPWSQPATLAACSAPGSPAIAFPSDSPQHGTGPGAIVWGAAARCPGGGGGPRVAAIAPDDDAPGSPFAARTPAGRALAIGAPLTVAAAPHGRILLAGAAGAARSASAAEPAGAAGGARAAGGGGTGERGLASVADTRAKSSLLLSEGPAGGPFDAPRATGGAAAPLAVANAYLGDVALASPSGGRAGAIELRMHRYYMDVFQPPTPIAGGEGVEGLALALDYRSDALATWERDGVIYTRFMPGSDRSEYPIRRVARAAPGARIAAVLSDDNRAILAWTETRGGTTSVYAELSGTGVRFGAPRLLERFADPGGGPPPRGGGPRLVRLASESVMLAWSGAVAGHWVVHTAAVDLNGVRQIETVSPPGRDAVLADLTPGPSDEAYALWSEPRTSAQGSLDYGDQALYAARGIDAYPGRTIFAAPEQIAAAGVAGTTGEAAVGVDPDTDRALAAWRTRGGVIDYSLRALGG